MADKKISALTAATTPLAGTEVLPIVQSGSTVKVSVDNLTAGRKVTASRVVVGTTDSTVGTLEANTTSSGATTRNVLIQNMGSDLNAGVRIDLMTSGNTNRVAYIKGVNVSGAGGATDVLIATNDDYGTPVDRLKISSTGDVTSLTGNLKLGTAGKGIDFSANTHAAGMTSEVLTWYEEGTWTPADASGAGLTFSDLSGNCYYTRVGNLVTCIFNITFPATADGTTCAISGLPFTSKSTTNAVAGGHFTYSGSTTVMTILVATAASQFFFYQFGGSNVINSDLSSKIIRGVITYMV